MQLSSVTDSTNPCASSDKARNAIETIEAAGGQFAMQSAANDIRLLKEKNVNLERKIEALEARNHVLESKKSRFNRDALKSGKFKRRISRLRSSDPNISPSASLNASNSLNASSTSKDLRALRQISEEVGDGDGDEITSSDPGDEGNAYYKKVIATAFTEKNNTIADLQHRLEVAEALAASRLHPIGLPDGDGSSEGGGDIVSQLQAESAAARSDAVAACRQQVAISRQRDDLERRVEELTAKLARGETSLIPSPSFMTPERLPVPGGKVSGGSTKKLIRTETAV